MRVILPVLLRKEIHVIGYVDRMAAACGQHVAQFVGLGQVNLTRHNILVPNIKKSRFYLFCDPQLPATFSVRVLRASPSGCEFTPGFRCTVNTSSGTPVGISERICPTCLAPFFI